jgi:DNA-binding MarR family transcriptional regulator
MVTEVANYRSRIWTGTITELHEQTGMARKTISAYLERLDAEGLIVVLEKAHGSRDGRIDVSLYYDELIVPNEREQRAAAKQKAAATDESALDSDRVSSASSLRHMTRPTWENTDLGGIEAIEEEKLQGSQPDANDLREFYESAVERWKETKIREVFDSALLDSGFDPFGCWWVEAETTGAGHQLRELLESINAGFEDF